jgi:hypothetical protein
MSERRIQSGEDIDGWQDAVTKRHATAQADTVLTLASGGVVRILAVPRHKLSRITIPALFHIEIADISTRCITHHHLAKPDPHYSRSPRRLPARLP